MSEKSKVYAWYRATGARAAHIVRRALAHKTWASVYRIIWKTDLSAEYAARIENEIIVNNLTDEPVPNLYRWDMSKTCANCPPIERFRMKNDVYKI